MRNSYEPSATSLPDVTSPAAQSRPVLLWLAVGFWLFSGIAGLIPILLVVPNLPEFPTDALLFVAAAALSQVLSLLGAIQLFRRKRSAILLLMLVFIVALVTLLLRHASPASMSTYSIIVWSIAGVTIGYAVLLKMRGVLT
ncbi:MAG: hypothetical protein ABL902_04830 [Gallionella sp.]